MESKLERCSTRGLRVQQHCCLSQRPTRPLLRAQAQHKPRSSTPMQDWLQSVADSHRDMATTMGILPPRPGKAKQVDSTQSEVQAAPGTSVDRTPSPEVAPSVTSTSSGGAAMPFKPPAVMPSPSPPTAYPIATTSRPSSTSPSPSPSPSPSRYPIPVLPSRSELLSNNTEYSNDPDQGSFEVLDELPPVPHPTLLPHSGLEGQDAADYEMRILAGEARDSLLAAGAHSAGSGMSSDDEDVGGPADMQEAIRQSQLRAAAIHKAMRRKRAEAAAAADAKAAAAAAAAAKQPRAAAPATPSPPAPAATALAASQDSAPARAPSHPVVAQAYPHVTSAVPPLTVAAAAGSSPTAHGQAPPPVSVPPAARVAAPALTSAPEASPAAAVVAATAAAATAVHSSAQAGQGMPSQGAGVGKGATSAAASAVSEQEEEDAPPAPPVVVAAHLLAAEADLDTVLASSDDDGVADEGDSSDVSATTKAPNSLLYQPNRFLHTQFLEPLSAESLSLAAELLQCFGKPADAAAVSSSGSSSLDELLASNDEAMEADAPMHAMRAAMQRMATPPPDAAAGATVAESQGTPATVATPSPEDKELCAALGVPPSALVVVADGEQRTAVSSVVSFVRARKAEEVGL